MYVNMTRIPAMNTFRDWSQIKGLAYFKGTEQALVKGSVPTVITKTVQKNYC